MSRYIYNTTELNKVALKHKIPKELHTKLEDLIDNAEMSLSNIWVSEFIEEINFNYWDLKKVNSEEFKEIDSKINKRLKKINKDLANIFDVILTTNFKSIQIDYFNSKVQNLKTDIQNNFTLINDKFNDIKKSNSKDYGELLNKLNEFYIFLENYQEEGELFEDKFKNEISYIQDIYHSFENDYVDKDYVAESLVSEIEDYLTFLRLKTLFFIAFIFDLTLTRD